MITISSYAPIFSRLVDSNIIISQNESSSKELMWISYTYYIFCTPQRHRIKHIMMIALLPLPVLNEVYRKENKTEKNDWIF